MKTAAVLRVLSGAVLAAAGVVPSAYDTTTSAATRMTASPSPSTASTTPPPSPSSSVEPACVLASRAWEAQLAVPTSDLPLIPAELAHDCLRSVPLHKGFAVELVDAITPYLEWQSDAAYKADPPADYFFPAYDMFEALAQVRANLVNDVYDSEYAFQLDLYVKVFGQGHDGHFVLYPDLLAAVFAYRRPVSLVSVSEDGVELPVVKVYEDVVASPQTASAVVRINGVDAATYLEDTIYAATLNQDPDAAYNTMFFEKAMAGAVQGLGYFAGGGRIRYLYPGPTTTLSFANGSDVVLANMAAVGASLEGITDGESMFERFCRGAYVLAASDTDRPPLSLSSSSSSSSSSSTTATATATAAATTTAVAVPGYPSNPVDITQDAIVSCYFLDGPGFEDVAVLSVLAFESESPAEFQAVQRNCIAQARANGRSKMVIDLSANGGGYILQGYDFFRQFFPHIVQDGFSRWKASDGFVAMAQLISELAAGVNPYTTGNASLVAVYENWFNYRFDLDIHDKPFASFADKFGPHVHADTNYTSIMRWNLDDPLATVNASYGLGMGITGYGNLTNTTQPFAADDIILLYDGYCASTCTLASEMLRLQGGVRSIAMGGRPRPGLIQGVGGIKGAQLYQFSDVYTYAISDLVRSAATAAQLAVLDRYSPLPILRSLGAAVNSRDQILRGNVHDGLPAQYVVEPADCRLYWTADMIHNVTAVWKAAAAAAFRGKPCAAGMLVNPGGPVHWPPSNAAAPVVDEESLAQRRAAAAQAIADRHMVDKRDNARFNAMFNHKVY